MAFLCMVVQEMVYAINCRNMKELTIKQGFFSNKAMNIGMIVLTLMQILVFTTPIGSIFKIVPLSMAQVGIIILINIFAFIFVDLSKLVLRKFLKD